MDMKKRILALLTATVMVLMSFPCVLAAEGMSDELKAAYDALEIPDADDVRGNITLPETGENDAEITWTSSNEAVVSTEAKENENYDPTPAGVVTRGEADQSVTLTATITLGDETATKDFDLTVRAAEETGELSRFLMYYFTGDSNNRERIWLASSEDGLNWNTLNGGDPILDSTLGERGLRDPYIFRSAEGDKFYLIATDLKVCSHSGNAWSDAQINGSKCIMVWESEDLVNWGEQRMVRVATDDMGCTWAPEVTYDSETGEYVLYWASKIIGNTYQSVYYAKTRDFRTFTEPKMFIQTDPNTGDEITKVIDATIIETDKGYYRFVKNENTAHVFLEYSEKLLGDYSPLVNNVYTDESGVEGPEIYQLNDGRYCLILDKYSSGGYFPYVTDDLESETYTKLESSEYSFPSSPRHGAVIRVTEEEYDRVTEAYNCVVESPAETVEPDEDGSDPILVYDFEDGGKDATGNGNDAYLGAGEIVEDEEKGNVLSLDGNMGGYLTFPKGFFDGRDELTVSMDVYSEMSSGNYFNFTIGHDSTNYLFTKVNSTGVRTAITTSSYWAEEGAEYSGDSTSFVNTWRNVTFTITPEKLRIYVDGAIKAETDLSVNTISSLGDDTVAYIGKSFYNADAYAAMKVDNVKVYNYALSEREITEDSGSDAIEQFSMTIDADEQGAEISDGMFGLFFEDINYGGDGGLYSEVINNRSFEAYSYPATDNTPIPEYGWTTTDNASAQYLSENPINQNNTTYLRLTTTEADEGIKNDCYNGFNVYNTETFNASMYARGAYEGKIELRILDEDGEIIGGGSFDGVTDEFKKYEFEVTASGDCTNATAEVVLADAGEVDLDMISLIPTNTYNGRDNGLRYDLVEKLAQLHPGFLRFPGGCVVEGYNLDNRYQWKHTVGPVEQRVQNWNRWQYHTSGDGRYGYCQTYGLGFYEYFLLCEDIAAKAVPVLNVGIGCQYQTGDYSSREELYSIFIQDALDLIEFANGTPDEDWESIDYSAVDSTNPETFNNNWANLRALMGHEDSFNLEYIGVGNEQWDTSSTYDSDEEYWAEDGNNFFKRYEAFEKAIHEVAPEMKLISTSGPSADGDKFVNAWNWLNAHEDDEDFTYAVDEHYYKTPDWFYSNINRYDEYDRDGFSVFAGEYAANGTSGNTFAAALAEAAYMTGLERNSDVVKMASYAPLFAQLGLTQWTPDLIWFNTNTAYGSADYYVQQLYSRNSGDYNLKNEVVNNKDTRTYSGYAGIGTWDTQASFSDFKVTDNESGEDITPAEWRGLNLEEPEKYELTISEVSAEPEAANPATSAIDGDLNTRWASQGRDNYIVVDLGEVKTVGKVGVAEMSHSERYYYYEVQISADGENYETITPQNSYDVSCALNDGCTNTIENAFTNGKGTGSVYYHFAGNKEVRYIKVLVKGNSYHCWNGVSEIEVYGECDQETRDTSLDPLGTWETDENGALVQSSSVSPATLFADAKIDAESYTLSFKAIKTGGNEGFLVPFFASDTDNYYFWNIAGWSNTLSAFQQRVSGSNTTVSSSVRTVLENDREYEIKLVVDGSFVEGYIDGELVNACELKKTEGPVYGNAIYDEETGDIIVKLINSDGAYKSIPVTINGGKTLSGTATEYILSGMPTDANSADDPENVSVTRNEIDGISSEFTYELPAYTVAVLRIHTDGKLGVDTIEGITASTTPNVLPALPESVTVTLSDATTEQRSVEWVLPEEGVFANEGTYKVYGRVEGTELDAEAIVTVSSGEAEHKLYEYNAEALLAGELTTIEFNPAESGNYKGILAVYTADGLSYVRMVEFTDKGGMTVKLSELDENASVKLMVWTSDTLAPAAEFEQVK